MRQTFGETTGDDTARRASAENDIVESGFRIKFTNERHCWRFAARALEGNWRENPRHVAVRWNYKLNV
jgi:hypothetical protein